MSKQIDLGEKFDAVPSTVSEKYYPTVNIPIKLDPEMVGKDIKLVVKANVQGIRQEKGTNNVTLELRSVKLDEKPKPKGAKRGVVYVKPWMNREK